MIDDIQERERGHELRTQTDCFARAIRLTSCCRQSSVRLFDTTASAYLDVDQRFRDDIEESRCYLICIGSHMELRQILVYPSIRVCVDCTAMDKSKCISSLIVGTSSSEDVEDKLSMCQYLVLSPLQAATAL